MTSFHYIKTPYKDIEKVEIVMCNGTEKVEQFSKRVGCDIAVNCGFFSWSTSKNGFAPVYTLKAQGKDVKVDSLFDGLAIKDNKMFIGNFKKIKCDDFVSGTPIIAYNRENMINASVLNQFRDIDGKRARTVIGFDNENIFLVVVNEKNGLYLQDLFTLVFGLGIPNAISTDGGGSTQLYDKGQVKVYSDRPVTAMLAMWLKKEDNMEWKAPNFNSISALYAQVDKNGKIQVQNNVLEYAINSARASKWAVWTKSGDRIFPESQSAQNPAPEPPKEVPKEEPTKDTAAESLLKEFYNKIGELFKW